ncbi:uncharacterized protein [Clytia hemisphaerica]|uniref:uncharacterized protein n=1 Tax=Clytia hemisphaerica TaxID=252671 RepID=UPI0034D6EEEE
MMDLENAINNNASTTDNEAEVEGEQDELMDGITQHDEQENFRGKEVGKARDSDWPPIVGDFLIGAFEDGFYPGEVVRVGTEDVNCNFMTPVSVNDQMKSLWKWPSNFEL